MRLNLISVYTLNQTTHWFIVGLFFPIMILFLIDKGLDNLRVGTTVAVYSAALVLLELPTGGLSDSIGRKRVYLISVTVQLASVLWLILSWNYAGLLIGFFGTGTARALSSGTIDAWFVDEFKHANPKGDLQKALAKANIFIPAGIAAGSLLGGVIPMTLGSYLEGTFGTSVYSANLIVMGVALVAQFIMTSILVVEVANRAPSSGVLSGLKQFPLVISASIKYGVKNKVILALMVASLALGFGMMSLEVFWQPQLKDILGPNEQSWIFGVMAAGYFLAASIGNILITPVCSKLGKNYPQTLMGLRLLLGASLMILAFQNTVLGFSVFLMSIHLINGMSNSPHAAIFNSQVPGERRSTLMSFESFVLQIGVLTGSLTFGYIAEVASIRTAWVVGGGLLMVSSAMYLLLSSRKYRYRIKADTCATEPGGISSVILDAP
jgi:DHA1 family quinolone resistance protein-like MFS transporter